MQAVEIAACRSIEDRRIATSRRADYKMEIALVDGRNWRRRLSRAQRPRMAEVWGYTDVSRVWLLAFIEQRLPTGEADGEK